MSAFISFLNSNEDVIRDYVAAQIEVNRLADELSWYTQRGLGNVKNDRRYNRFVLQYARAIEAEAEARANVRAFEFSQLTGLRKFVYRLFVH